MAILQSKSSKSIFLSSYAVYEITGDDAKKFLQGQIPTNLNPLRPGQHTLSCVTTHKGKVVAIFRLVCLANNQYYFLGDTSEVEAAVEYLKKFAIFNKVQFALTELKVIAKFIANDSVAQQFELGVSPLMIPYDSNLMFELNQIIDNDLKHNENDLNYVIGYLMNHGVLQLTSDQRGEYLAQALGLELQELAIAFNKGCYQGQEAIARAKYRGINKYSLQVFSCNRLNNIDSLTFGQQIEVSLDDDRSKNTGIVIQYLVYQDITYLSVIIPSFDPSLEYSLSGYNLKLIYSSTVPVKT